MFCIQDSQIEIEEKGMGLLDGFTSDGTVDMKYTEFYKLMREAARAELMENAARCNVPHEYVREMLTGKMEAPEILPEVEPHPDYEIESMITSARRFLRMLPDEERLARGVETLNGIVALAETERLNEIILDNAEKLKARDAAGEKREPETWGCEMRSNHKKRNGLTTCGFCEDGSKYTPMDAGQQDLDGEREDGSHGNE